MSPSISPQRKNLYRIGQYCVGIGVLLFLSTFVTFILNFGDFSNFDAKVRSSGIRAFGGMGLMLLGGVLMSVGAAGRAGSGLILDPDQARKDLAPWSRQAGGMLRDTLDAAGLPQPAPEGPLTIIKVRCRSCQTLNDEHARFCNQCAAPV